MKIGLDYDNTVTEDPKFWSQFIALAKQQMHTVTIVTFRTEECYRNEDVISFAKENEVDLIFTNGIQKSTIFQADVWIDDTPVTIPTPDELIEMRTSCLLYDEIY